MNNSTKKSGSTSQPTMRLRSSRSVSSSNSLSTRRRNAAAASARTSAGLVNGFAPPPEARRVSVSLAVSAGPPLSGTSESDLELDVSPPYMSDGEVKDLLKSLEDSEPPMPDEDPESPVGSSGKKAAGEAVKDAFVAFLNGSERYSGLTVMVDDPVVRLSAPVGEECKVMKIFAVGFDSVSANVVRLVNKVLVDWQTSYRRVSPERSSGCPFYKASTQTKHVRSFLAFLAKNHGWLMTLDTFSGFKGCLVEVLESLYNQRVVQWVSLSWYCLSYWAYFNSNNFHIYSQPSIGTRKKNLVEAGDAVKISLSSFNEEDYFGHMKKVLVGCGCLLGFRGVKEHLGLLVEDFSFGKYPYNHEFFGLSYIRIDVLRGSKNRSKLSVSQSYFTETGNLLRVPIFTNSCPQFGVSESDCFGGSLRRYVLKAKPGQVKLHVFPDADGNPDPDRPLSVYKCNSLHKEAATDLGIKKANIGGGHCWRSLFCTTLANDPNVSLAEGMRASRHKSVSAHCSYISTDTKTEATRWQTLSGSMMSGKGKKGLKSEPAVVKKKDEEEVGKVKKVDVGENGNVVKQASFEFEDDPEMASFIQKALESGDLVIDRPESEAKNNMKQEVQGSNSALAAPKRGRPEPVSTLSISGGSGGGFGAFAGGVGGSLSGIVGRSGDTSPSSGLTVSSSPMMDGEGVRERLARAQSEVRRLERLSREVAIRDNDLVHVQTPPPHTIVVSWSCVSFSPNLNRGGLMRVRPLKGVSGICAPIWMNIASASLT